MAPDLSDEKQLQCNCQYWAGQTVHIHTYSHLILDFKLRLLTARRQAILRVSLVVLLA